MRYGSVCSGIEAATCAWHPLGWEPQFFSEVDKAASRFLAKKYPTVTNHGDMTKFQEWPDHAIDLLVGGTPCQSFSVAGLRKGLADPRGNLMLTYLAIADRYRPEWLVWENVPGVLSSNGGRDFGSFLGGLGELGYGFAYRVLDAQFVRVESHPWAVPQRRRRVFVVGHLGDWRRAAAVLFERESLQGHSPPRREAGKGTAHGVAPSLVSSGRGVERRGDTRGQDPVVAEIIAPAVIDPPEVSAALKARDYKGQSSDGNNDGQPILAVMAFKSGQSEAAGGVFVTNDFSPTLQAQNNGSTAVPSVAYQQPIAIQGAATRENPSSGPDGVGAAYTLEARQEVQAIAFPEFLSGTQVAASVNVAPSMGALNPTAVAFQPRIGRNGRGYEEEVFPALNGADAGATSDMRPCVAYPSNTQWAVRRLTPLECTRLQGFPDDYFAAAEPIADGPKYKMLGNSMAVNCMTWLGERITAVAATPPQTEDAA